MTAPTLKPCPFCGSEDVASGEHCVVGESGALENTWFVYCVSCHAQGPRLTSGEETGWDAAPRPPTQAQDEGRQRAKVRIAVAVDEGGRTASTGRGYMSGALGGGYTEEALACEALDLLDASGPAHVVWVTAEVPLPPSEVQGEVEQ